MKRLLPENMMEKMRKGKLGLRMLILQTSLLRKRTYEERLLLQVNK